MNTEWMGRYREFIRILYRSANEYSLVCRNESYGDSVKFSPYEVQIIEHLLEYGHEHHNMKWYACQLGLSQSSFSRNIKQLTEKGLVERFHNEKNQKDIIVQVSALGRAEYEKYARELQGKWFGYWFKYLDTLTEEELAHLTQAIRLWREKPGEKESPPAELVRIDGRAE